MDVPLFIRMLEYAKEDAKTDMDLHKATERAIELSQNGVECLGMDNYNKIVGAKAKKEVKEMDSGSSGSFEAPMSMPIIKRKINEEESTEEEEDEAKKGEYTEATTTAVSAGAAYDVPFGGGPRGKKDPLSINKNYTEAVKSTRAVRDKNFPKFGGPGGVFIKVKEKCKKFPYCNQGDINAIEPLNEAITETVQKYGISREEVEKIILKEIKDIFI